VRRKAGTKKRSCSGCGRHVEEIHEVVQREVRDPLWGEYRVTVLVEVCRIRCPDCGPRIERVPQLPSKAPFSKRFEEAVHDIELVLDLVDGDTQERSWAVLKRGGTLISTLSEPSAEKAREHAARAEHYMAQPDGAELRDITALIDAGKVMPHIQAVFPFNEVRQAQQQLEHSHVQGKIVLELEES